MNNEVFREALGVRAGDRVQVWWAPRGFFTVAHLTRPRYVTFTEYDIPTGDRVLTIRDYPVMSIVCAEQTGPPGRRAVQLDRVFRHEGRWYEEPYHLGPPTPLVIEPAAPSGQLPMLGTLGDAVEPEPLTYRFDPKVNYRPGPGEPLPYRCGRCNRDANLPRREPYGPGRMSYVPLCPWCPQHYPMIRVAVRWIAEVMG